jgi:DNA-binding CsgD family transcriptional regulator
MSRVISEKKLNVTYAITAGEDLKSICKPLLAVNIKHFCYLRLFKNGAHQLLCTDPEWVRSCYLYHYAHTAFHQDPSNYQTGYELWTNPKDQTIITVAREQFNIAHGIALVKRIGEDCELFHFATSRDNFNIVNFYINNLDFLENFALYFKSRAQPLIKKSMSDQLILPQWGASNSERINSTTSIPNSIWNTFVEEANGKTPFTKRELQCIQFTLRGQSAKQVGFNLGISQRTVEEYLQNVKNKLGVHSKSQLIAKLLPMSHLNQV